MMNKKIDYSISDKMEKKPVGYIKDCFTGECLEYYCEKKLLEEYERIIEYMGCNGVQAHSYKKDGKTRHGLKYSIIEIYAGEFGLDYTKEEYEKEYLNNEPQKEKQKGVMDNER